MGGLAQSVSVSEEIICLWEMGYRNGAGRRESRDFCFILWCAYVGIKTLGKVFRPGQSVLLCLCWQLRLKATV